MQFSSILVAAFASIAVAENIIEFVNQDAITRSIYFTQNLGLESIPTLNLTAHATVNVTFPHGWIGNFFAVSDGADIVPGMLGEVAFNSWDDTNFFDVSAIVNPDDITGVKMLFPKVGATPVSGCQTFPCAHAYNKPDDIQTQGTKENTLVCLLGNNSNSTEEATVQRRHPRHFVTHGRAHESM